MKPIRCVRYILCSWFYSDDIDYTYKSTDREALNRLLPAVENG